MMWQSSMLISLLVLSHQQIYVLIWVIYGFFYRKPITLLEPLVVLIGRHKDMLVKRTQTRMRRMSEVSCWGKVGELGLVWCAGVAFRAVSGYLKGTNDNFTPKFEFTSV